MSRLNVTRKLIDAHLMSGRMTPGEEIALAIDQTLTQDATGTLVMQEFEAMGIERVQTELSAQYVDHNLLQEDFKNPDDHLFLCRAPAASSGCGSATPATASVIPSTRSDSAFPARPWWAPTATRPRPGRSACSPPAPASDRNSLRTVPRNFPGRPPRQETTT